jgi:hypothetical protein
MAKKKKLKNFKVMTARGGDAARSDAASGRSAGRADPSGGVDRSGVGAGSQYAQNRAKAAIDAQRKKTIQQLTPPSQTIGGQLLRAGLTLSGVPFAGTVTKKLIDKPYWQRGKKPTKETQIVKDSKPFTPFGAGEGDVQKPIIAGPIPINQPIQSILPLSQRRLATVSPTGRFGYTVGLKKGGLLRQGKPKLTKKGWK